MVKPYLHTYGTYLEHSVFPTPRVSLFSLLVSPVSSAESSRENIIDLCHITQSAHHARWRVWRARTRARVSCVCVCGGGGALEGVCCALTHLSVGGVGHRARSLLYLTLPHPGGTGLSTYRALTHSRVSERGCESGTPG